ncbi:alpha-ribazole phosphatase [Puteibacter caeruleilacunae]|nr:alpha-ribazole phosphatase [Puteibacter caeruleilacunae]
MILLIRHTKPEVEKGICYGQADLDVAGTFFEEVDAIRDVMPKLKGAYIHSSPLQRCSKLAKELFPNDTIHYDQQLMELDFGEWEMKAWSEIDETALRHWGDNFVEVKPPKGECLKDVQRRVLECWKTLDKNETHVIVAHDGVLRIILSELLEIPLRSIFRMELPYGTVVKLKYNQGVFWKLGFIK